MIFIWGNIGLKPFHVLIVRLYMDNQNLLTKIENIYFDDKYPSWWLNFEKLAFFGSFFSTFGRPESGQWGHLKHKEPIMTAQAISLTKNPTLPKFNKAKVFKAIFVVVFLTALWHFRTPVQELLSLVKDRDGVIAYLGEYGNLGAVLLFIILFAQVIVAAIPGHVFMVAGGYLYGLLPGFLLIHTATVVASQFGYWLARKFGRPVVEKLAPAQVLATWTERAERQGTIFFIFSFILPIFPSDVMNFVAGLSGLSSRKFWVANFVGRLPTSILFALIGAQGFRISPALFVIAVIFTIVMYFIWRKIGPMIEQQ